MINIFRYVPLALSAFVFSFLFTTSAHAQAEANVGSVKGVLTDTKNQPIPYATITLLRADNSVVNGDLSKEDGTFNITTVPAGSYRLRINALGYDEKIIADVNLLPGALEKNLQTVQIAGSATSLQNVEFVGERNQLEMGIDKKTFNVDKNITATGGSATDVLQNVPSITVDADGSLSLRGKGNVTVLIDGKPAALLGGDEASALQALPASSIDNIEIITNPSAKYDAQGMTGIINIVTKKDKKVGFNGNVNIGVGTGHKYNGGFGVNLRTEKWNVYLNSNGRHNRNFDRETTRRTNLMDGYSFESYEDGYRRFRGLFTTAGADYYANKYHTISLTQNINSMRFARGGFTTFDNYLPGNEVDSQMKRFSQRDGGHNSYSTTLSHKWKFNNPKQELNTSATFSTGTSSYDQDINTEYFHYNSQPYYGPVRQQQLSDGGNSNWNVQSDFNSNLFSKEDRFETGLKYQRWDFETFNTPTVTLPQNGGSYFDSALVNRYRYDQSIYAAYLNYSNNMGKWGYQAGLRMEYALYNGETQITPVAQFANEYLSLFPSAYLSYNVSDKKSIYLNYSRRTNRPRFWDLMPFIDISNPISVRKGNPDLRPEFINNFELSYSQQFEKGHNLILSSYVQYTTDLIERYRQFFSDGTSLYQPMNLNSGTTYGAEAIARLQFLPIWDATVSVNAFRNIINGANIDPALDNSGFGWFTKLNTTVKLPAQFSFQLMGNYESPRVSTQSNRLEMYWMDVAVKKSFWKNNGSLTLNVSDILNTRKRNIEYDLPAYYQINYNDRESRIATLTFTYRFGNADVKVGSRRSRNSQQKSNEVKERDNIKQSDDGDQGGM